MAAIAAVVVAGLGTAAFLVTNGDDEPEPDELLDAARATVEDADSLRFSLSGEFKAGIGSEENGVAVSSRYRGNGAMDGQNWEMTVENGFAASEGVYVPDGLYERAAATRDDLEAESWLWYEAGPVTEQELLAELEYMGGTKTEDVQQQLDDPSLTASDCENLVGVMATEMVFIGGGIGPIPETELYAGTPGDVVGDPAAFLAAIEQMTDPTVVDGDEGTTLAATLRADEDQVEAFGRALLDAQVELDLDEDDRPTELRYEVAAGETSSRLTVKFSAWNEAIEVAVPADEDIEATPEIDEEGLSSVTEFDLVAPTNPPAGWLLSTWSPEELWADGTAVECEMVQLKWDAPLTDDASDEEIMNADYLMLTLMSVDCDEDRDDTPFEPGGPGGFPSRTGNIGLLQVQVGDTVVEVDTTLSTAERDAILATLAPVDAATLIAAATPAG